MLKEFILAFLYANHRVIYLYRISRWFYKKKMLKIAYAVKSIGITLNGCDISPAAIIGDKVTFCHTVGIVIGEGVIIGDNVTIYQNVTLGTKNGVSPEYPTIGDNVKLFAGCVIVGSIEIEDNSLIGANAVITKDVPSNSIAMGIPMKIKPII